MLYEVITREDQDRIGYAFGWKFRQVAEDDGSYNFV